jgi:hypothetical protein
MKLFLVILSAFFAIKEVILQTSFVDEINPPIGLLAIVVIFVFSTLSIPLLLSFQKNNPWLYKVWIKPRWNSNPFNFRNPVDFFSLAGYNFLTYGIIAVVGNLFRFQKLSMNGLVISISGAGILLGIFLTCELFFKDKFKKAEEAAS